MAAPRAARSTTPRLPREPCKPGLRAIVTTAWDAADRGPPLHVAERRACRRPFTSPGHCGVMPDSLTTFPHLTNSDSMNLPKSTVLILMISAPSFASCACMSGADCTSPIVLCSLSMIEGGVPAGAMIPHQFTD